MSPLARGNRRWIPVIVALTFMLLAILLVFGGGCGSVREGVDRLRQERDDLARRLEETRQRVETLLGELKALGWAENAVAPDLAIADVAIVTTNVDEEGRLYGEFAVKATVKNRGATEAGPVVVGAVLLITNNRYHSLVPVVTAACQQIDHTAAGGEATVTLAGLSTGHPELDHHLLVMVEGASQEANLGDNVKQMKLLTRFAPGSPD